MTELEKEIQELRRENEQLRKERDAYAKAFRIRTSDEKLINHVVFKLDYAELIAHNMDELMPEISYRLASTIEDARRKGE